MSKIERYQGNLRAFASNAQGLERTVFGGTEQANDLTSQVTAAFLRGWGIVGPSEHPSLEDFNAAMFAMSQFLAYQHQIGTPEWHTEQEYYTGSVCIHGGVSYQSLIDDNVGNEPPSEQWTPVLTAKSGGEAFQPKNDNLTALSSLVGAANKLPYFTGANALSLTNLTPAARALIAQTAIVATSAEMQAGTSTNLLPSVAAVMSLFSKRSFSDSDYIRIPDVPGGMIIQWGIYTPSGGNQTFTLPTAFPNAHIASLGTIVGASTLWGFITTNKSGLGQFSVATRSSSGTLTATPCFVVSIGN